MCDFLSKTLIRGAVVSCAAVMTGCGSPPDIVEPGNVPAAPSVSADSTASTDTSVQIPADPTGFQEAVSVTAIDVGKGDCLLISLPGACGMIDTGYYDTADRVLDFLDARGVDALDFLLITHYDKDHVGGAYRIAEALPIERIYLPDYESDSSYYVSFMNIIDKKNLDYVKVSEDTSFDLGNARFDIYASDCEYRYDEDKGEPNDNDLSVVTAMYYGDDSWLFAGDIEEEGIDRFLDARRGSFDVLKMPHHGRKESNTDSFIDSVSPEIAIITDSVDEDASKKVLKNLEEAGSQVYASSQYGDITVTGYGAGTYSIETGVNQTWPEK